MTPADVREQIKAYMDNRRDSIQQLEYAAWLNGIYVVRAIGCTFGNKKYPENPITAGKTLTEEDVNPDDPEKNERIAVAEMAMWASSLRNQGLPETYT
ncbi:hypothetical protein LI010_19925 [Enterocloster aldenensis]|uniref:hypothetical protein n=1 Tax=Enterocloster aldenensis TaxID=358742 RepID=UPI001D085472|nr:hypothetical protein [Enterocloster aldenensis]